MVDLTPRGLIQQIVQSAASSDSTMPLLIEFAQKFLSLLEHVSSSFFLMDFLESYRALEERHQTWVVRMLERDISKTIITLCFKKFICLSFFTCK